MTKFYRWLSLALDIPFTTSDLVVLKYQNECNVMESQLRFLLGTEITRMA